MARLFRLLDKKRGERRTGSQWAGGVVEAVFFGVVFVLGLAALAFLISPNSTAAHPRELGYGYWMKILVMSACSLCGGTGMVWALLHLGTSVERRSALARQAAKLDLRDGSAPPHPYPTIPSDDGLTNSPGIELAYRLPPAQSPVIPLLSAATFTVLWNGLTVMLLVWAFRAPDWFLGAVLLPFLAVGGWSIAYFCRQLWIHTGMGQTTVEVCDHPFLPRHRYQAVLAQAGHMRVNRLELLLICEEEATYHQGTDIRTEVGRVYEALICADDHFLIEPSQPFRRACSFEIPASAMHSLQAQNHGVHWRLVVRGSVEGWPDFERGFPIIVHPGEMTSLPEDAAVSAAKMVLQPHVNLAGTGAGVSA